MINQEVAQQLSTLIKTFNDKRVISAGEIEEVLAAIVAILAENKKGVEALTAETKQELESAIQSIADDHEGFMKALEADVSKTRADIEKATKAQNERAFKRLQTLMSDFKLRIPKDGAPGRDGEPGPEGPPGAPGKDGSPDTPLQVRDKLESLEGEERLDAKAIKNLPQFIKEKGKEMLVGGIRFLEQLADVSVLPAKKRPDLLLQYNDTTKRWENGVALTVSATEPSDPEVNDIWIDTN